MSISIVSAAAGTASVQGIPPNGDPSAKTDASAVQAPTRPTADAGSPLDDKIPPAIVAMLIHQQLSNGSSFDT